MYAIVERLARIFDDAGCGATFDFFRGTGSAPSLIQWLWAIPVREIDERDLDDTAVVMRIVRELGAVGFRPVEASAGSRTQHLSLPNGSRYEEECPFDSALCTGPHLVVSGAGTVDPDVAMRPPSAAPRR